MSATATRTIEVICTDAWPLPRFSVTLEGKTTTNANGTSVIKMIVAAGAMPAVMAGRLVSSARELGRSTATY